ncbi:hypothetical protein XPA_004714 [Xanthoria parietina]
MQISRKHDDDAGADQRAPRDPLAAHTHASTTTDESSIVLVILGPASHLAAPRPNAQHSPIARQSQVPSPNAPRTTGRPTPSTAHAIPHPTRSLGTQKSCQLHAQHESTASPGMLALQTLAFS